MPRLSLYRPNKSNDYKFLDKTIKEMFTVGATDLLIHKYLGSDGGKSADLTQPPVVDKLDPTKIQDLLFLENRDRKYDKDVYCLRGHYNVQNLDFDLSQFGLFLNSDIIFITVHYNDMIDTIGRKLMVGDVFELPHLTDYHPLNETIPVGLRRYYQITDANFASEGYTATWYPHLWRIKCEPLVDSQEFSNILSKPLQQDNYLGDWDKTKTYVPGYVVTYGDKNWTALTDIPVGTPCQGTAWDDKTVYAANTLVTKDGVTYITTQTTPRGTSVTNTTYFTPYWELDAGDNLRDILGRYNKNIAINDAAITEAARLLPKTGYDRSQLYLVPTTNNKPQAPVNLVTNNGAPVPGQVVMVASAGYSASPAIRIGAGALGDLFKLTGEDADALSAFLKISLQTASLAAEVTDTGSGQVKGNMVIAAHALGPASGPVGTADNTYSSTDQYPTFTLTTSMASAVNTTTLAILDLFPTKTPDTWYNNPNLVLSINITTIQGNIVEVFGPNTKIISVDELENTVTLNKPTIAGLPAGATITVASDFTGTVVQDVMDYRADADPNFRFIARFTPESFGYTDGYMIGDGTAPNGLPTGSGIVFPTNPGVGAYFLRTDYLPQQLFRWDGSLWIKISDNVRADPSMGSSDTQLGSFINNNNQTTLTDGTTIPEQQSLSSILKIIAD